MKNYFLKKYILLILLLCLIPSGCSLSNPLNSPYPKEEADKNIFYSSFSERPKHFDPARSYSSNEYAFIGQIYEPPFQYHYLKRPFQLIPLTAVSVPSPVYYNSKGERISGSRVDSEFSHAIYEITIKSGIFYQDHPAFAKDNNGNFLYHSVTEEDMDNIYELKDFPVTGTRELVADDYVYQIKRMANPKLHCPIFSILAAYIDGFSEYSGNLSEQLSRIRKEREKLGGAGYNRLEDERDNPIFLDLDAFPLKGVEAVSRYTFRIRLKKKYPQFIYWMAMPFFSPMPKEADIFYTQGPLLKRQISLNWYPIGTGPYRLSVNNPSKEIILLKNENFHNEYYPSEGFHGAKEKGLLDDAGKKMPFIEKAVFKLETEDIPYWNKFLQGYYDTSGISSDSFDQAINITADGDVNVSDQMKKRNIKLSTSVKASTYYLGFNMLDDVVGGYTEEKKKLRQAISIAIDYEEYIQIFLNGRGIPAQGPLPPGIAGYIEGKNGINPYVYNWKDGRAARKSVEEAKRLLSEAGYPGGKDIKTGKPLIIYFDTAASGPDSKSYTDWLRKQFKKIDIQLVVRSTDYNRFQEKMLKGMAQMFQWGWNADYPDPENFFFLLYGPNKKVGNNGENAANYQNEQFDKLFRLMENMENSDKRLSIIQEMNSIIREDSPWIWGFHPISYGLYHDWFKNSYPNIMANNTLKYKRIAPLLRKKMRSKWNRPVLWPVFLFFISITIFIIQVYNNNKKNEVS